MTNEREELIEKDEVEIKSYRLKIGKGKFC